MYDDNHYTNVALVILILVLIVILVIVNIIEPIGIYLADLF